MDLLDKLGFNPDFDSTAAGTRRKARTRIGISVVVFAFSAPILGWAQTLIWTAMFLVAEAWMWSSTAPRSIAANPVRARAERVAATFLATFAWVILSLFYWNAGEPSLRLVAVAMLAGVILYAQKSCDKTAIHMIGTAVPPGVVLLILPFTLKLTVLQTVAIECAMILLVGFGSSAAIMGLKGWRELKAATEELIGERETARAASRAKSEFLANMSHEIRTPLNGVVGVVDVLARTKLDPEQRQMLEIVRASGATLERLLSDVLDISRIESGRVEIETRPFALGEAVRDVVALSSMRAIEKNIALRLDLAAEVEGSVAGDAVRLKQILGNLLSNAVKFTEAGQVSLSVTRTHHEGRTAVRFDVGDTGVGFDASEKDRIFGRFQQADGSISRRYGGAGLGLSIARQLSGLMGGTLDCVSELGRGSVFTLILPLERLVEPAAKPAPTPADPVPLARSAPAPELQFEPGSRLLKVLLADDHPVNRKVVELILGGAGVELTSVEDGKQACEAFAVGGYDLVFMDMQMPVMDGLTAVRLIRAREAVEGGRAPILMLTANALPEHVAAAELAGADGHLAKPITAQALFAAVESARARNRGDESERAEAAA